MAAIADGEGRRDFRPLDCVEYLLFQVLKKKQKGTGTLAAVSRTPQRSLDMCEASPRRAHNALKFVRRLAASRSQRFLVCAMTCRVAPEMLFGCERT